MYEKKKEKIEGGPSRRLAGKIPKTRDYPFGCMPNQEVIISKGLGRKRPLKCFVLREYDSHISFFWFSPDGSTQHTSINKASLLCGDARILHPDGSVIGLVEETPKADEKKPEKRKPPRQKARGKKTHDDYSLI